MRRALQTLMRSKQANIFNRSEVGIGDRVGYFYNSSKSNERAEWRESKVKCTHEHMVEVETGKKGRDARVAYEDLRILPAPGLVEDIITLTEHGAEGIGAHHQTHMT